MILRHTGNGFHRQARPWLCGASKDDVARAIRVIDNAGGPEAIVRIASESNARLHHRRYTPPPANRYSVRQIAGTFRGEKLPVLKYRNPFRPSAHVIINHTQALALEMALQEEAERNALEGEIAALEAAWREAEEIARIADALPDVPPPDPRLQSRE